jgi:GxxExxY protein
MEENYISGQIVDSAILVHKELGPGLLESVYEEALCMELTDRGFFVERQKDLPVFFRGKKLEQGFRTDLIVNNAVIVELKSVEKLTPVFYKVTQNYLRLTGIKIGLLINFNEILLKNGLHRIVWGNLNT